MEPHLEPTPIEAAPAPAVPVEEVPLPAPAEVDAPVAPVESVASVTAPVTPRTYPSLYDHTSTTLAAILMGAAIVGAIQVLVVKMYSSAKSEHDYLTRFVTSLVAMVVGCYIADLLIAGPDTSLLTEDEHTLILTFIKDTALMIFSYYFGLKAQAPKEASDG